jgi:hypothetical protein
VKYVNTYNLLSGTGLQMEINGWELVYEHGENTGHGIL